MLTSGELLHVRRPYQIISEVNYVLKLWTIRSAGSKEIYNQRYGRFNIDKIWRDDILPCRLYLRHWWVFPVERYRHIVLNALWSCFFHLLHKFVTNIAQSMHATNNLGYILSVIPCIAHPWDWHLKASCISEGKMVSLLSDIWKQATFLKQREIIAFNTLVIQENIFLVHNDNSLLYEVWYREAWFYWYFY